MLRLNTGTGRAATPPRPSAGRAATAALVLLALLLTHLVTAPGALAAVGQKFKYYGSYDSGSVRLAAPYDTATYAARAYDLTGVGGATSTGGGYSVDFTGTPPTNNNDYEQVEWSAPLLSEQAVAHRGPIEWILKNSYPALDETALRERVRATDPTFPTGYLPINDAVAATQAAIWHYTDGVDLDQDNTTVNTTRIKKLYAWLLEQSADRQPSTSSAPTLDLTSDGGRTTFPIEPGAALGPFTITSSTPVTLSLSGDAARVVDSSGATLGGSLASGTQFWVLPTGTPALPGSVTVGATGQNVTTTVLNAAKGTQNVSPYAARETLAQLSSSTQRATASLALSWVIDSSSPGSFDPDGAATARAYVHYPRAELSATLQDVVFTDGTTTETDLIGLQGTGSTRSADVYSADYAGTVPAPGSGRRGPQVASGTQFAEGDWAGDARGELTWILQRSYPELSVGELTADLKAAGALTPDAGNIKNWEAIAATQAAIWHYTDGKTLDTTRYLDPVGTRDGTTAEGVQVRELTFAVPVEVRTYAVTAGAGNAPTSWKLQRSSDGKTWADVSSSATSHVFGAETETRRTVLGASAVYGGYTHYRLVVTGAADASEPAQIDDVTFTGFGVFGTQPNYVYAEYANATNVVKAYEYLVAGAEEHGAGVIPADPGLAITGPGTEIERTDVTAPVGPFTVTGDTAARVTVAGSADATLLASADADPQAELVLAPGAEFWVSPGPDEDTTFTLTATGTAVNYVSARELVGTRNGSAGAALIQLGVAAKNAQATLDAHVVVPAPVEPPAPAAPAWDKGTVYLTGDQVTFDGRLFQAQWWTQGETPGTSSTGAWAEVGVEVTTADGAHRRWTSSWTYVGGETVVHGDKLWKAQWWTRDQEPGASPWGPWVEVAA